MIAIYLTNIFAVVVDPLCRLSLEPFLVDVGHFLKLAVTGAMPGFILS